MRAHHQSVASEASQRATPGDTLLPVVRAWVCSLPPCSGVCARAGCREAASQRGNRPRFVTPAMIGVTAWGYVPSTPTPVAPTRRLLTRCGVHLKRHLSDDCTHDTILQMVFAAPTGGANLLSLGLKCLDMPVPCARVRLPRGEIERWKSRSSRQSPAHAPHPPCSYCSRKHHESAMNSVRGRGGSNGSAASGKRESHEGRVLCPFDFSDQTRCASRGKTQKSCQMTAIASTNRFCSGMCHG